MPEAMGRGGETTTELTVVEGVSIVEVRKMAIGEGERVVKGHETTGEDVAIGRERKTGEAERMAGGETMTIREDGRIGGERRTGGEETLIDGLMMMMIEGDMRTGGEKRIEEEETRADG